MFCKWCGKKIVNIGAPCPNCGRMQDPLESGNGFWDLYIKKDNMPRDVDHKKNISDKRVNAEKKPEEKIIQSRSAKVNKNVHAPVLFSLGIIMLLGLAVMAISMSRAAKEILSLRESINGIEQKQSVAVEEIKDDITCFESKLEAIIERIDPKTSDLDVTENYDSNDTDDHWNDGLPEINNNLVIKRYTIDDKKLYVAAGNIRGEVLHCMWQRRDPKSEWNDVAEDTLYIVEDTGSSRYRLVMMVREKQTIRLFGLKSEFDQAPVKVTITKLGNEFALYNLIDADGYEYEWQYSDDGKAWHSMNAGTDCLINLRDGKMYRLSIIKNKLYRVDNVIDGDTP